MSSEKLMILAFCVGGLYGLWNVVKEINRQMQEMDEDDTE